MSKKKKRKAKRRKARSVPPDLKNRLFDEIRQFQFPPEFRIAAPAFFVDVPEIAESDSSEIVQQVEEPLSVSEQARSYQMVAEMANCLWYVKTKHFRRDWESKDTGDEDPRVRRALGRLNRGIDSLKEGGFEVHDPTNERYPQGGENMMRPIQFQPTAGLTFDKVTETVTPIIYHNDRLIQRGEVFVAVPKEAPLKVSDQTSEPASLEAAGSAPSEPVSTESEADLQAADAVPDSKADAAVIVEDKPTSDKTDAEQAGNAGMAETGAAQVGAPTSDGAIDEQIETSLGDKPEPEQNEDSNTTDADKETEMNKN